MQRWKINWTMVQFCSKEVEHAEVLSLQLRIGLVLLFFKLFLSLLLRAIRAVKSNAVGLDGIPLKFIQLFLPLILLPLTQKDFKNSSSCEKYRSIRLKD
jgi:hypothetical protein